MKTQVHQTPRRNACRWLFFLLIGMATWQSKAQTILIDSAGAGGFELGTDFASNGWTVVNGTATNKWFVGSAGSPFSGSRSAYVDNGTGATNAFTTTAASTVHFYRDVTFPAGETKITLSFRWKAQGESTFDYITVYTMPTSVTPTFNVPTGGGSSWNNIPTNYSGAVVRSTPPNLNLQGSYQTQTISLPATFAGTTQRLVFMWSNDGSGGTQPPGSVDNIHLVSTLPTLITSTTTGGVWSNPLTWVGGVVPGADSIVIAPGANVTLDVAASATTLTLQTGATLNCNAAMSVAGNMTIASGATYNGFFGTGGIATTVNGNITNNGTFNIALPGASLVLSGNSSQTISGTGSFSLIPTLTVNNLAGVLMNTNLRVSNALNLTNGILGGTGTLTLGNATFSNTFAMTSTGGSVSASVVSGLAGILPGNATFTYNAPNPIASVTTGNELSIVAPTTMNVTFNAIAGGNYTLGTNINVNNFTVNDTITTANTVTVNGVATFGANPYIDGSGTFTMGPNATLVTASLLGITASSSTGSVRTNIRNYAATGNYTFNGAAGQVTGDGLPATLTGGTVTISTTSGTLLSQATVFNNLTLTTNLLLGTNAVTVNGIATLGTLAITGAGSFTAGPASRLLLNSAAAAGVLQTTGANGNIQCTGGRTYTPGLDIVIGGSAVATGDNFPTTGIDSLVLNQTTAVTLTAPISVNTLNITNTGRMTTTTVNSLTVLGTAAGNVARISTGYIDGPLTRTIGVGANGNFTFPLGVGTTGNLGIEIINPVVTGSSVTLTAIARSIPTGGTVGTGLTALTNTRYWAIAPVSGSGVLASVGNVRIFESTAATLGGTSKKIGMTTAVANNIYNSIGGQLDSLNVNILSSLTVPAFGVGSDSTFFVLGNGSASGVFTGGTIAIGPTGAYRSLTAAIAAINERTSISAPVILEFQSTYTPDVEAYPIVFRATLPTTSTNTITIRPSSAVTSAINFNGSIFTATSLIDFNGGKNIIIDGRPGGTGTNRFLAFNQLNVGGFPTFRFINEAQNDTLRFLTVAGQNTSTSSALILFSTTNGTTGNNNIAVSNCNINGLSNTVNCILGSGTATPADNKNITINNNNIFDFFLNGSSPTGIIAGTASSGWTISANNFYQTAVRNSLSVPAMTSATSFRAIQLNTTAANAFFTVTNNRVGGNIPGIPGSVFELGDSISNLGHLFRPLDFSNAGTTTSPANSVQGNIISDITLYTNGTDNFTGIGALQTGVYNVGNLTPNIVGSATANGSIKIFHRSASAGTARGLHFTATGGGNMQNNVVGGVDLMVQGAQAAGGSITFQGILVSATFANPVTISGNTFGSTTTANSIQGQSSSLGATGITGMVISGATGAAVTVASNTIQNFASFSNAFSTVNTVRGIFVTGASSVSTTVSANTIRNLRCDAPNNAADISASVLGIACNTTGAGRQLISNNTIHSLISTYNGPVANVAQGIFYNSTNTSGTSLIERNTIHSLETGSTNTFTLQSGINIGSASTTLQAINNFVRLGVNVAGTTNNANTTLYGILKQNTTNTSILHNTVYIAGNPTATDTLSLSAAFYKLASASVDTVMNNIFMNARSNASGTGEHYAMRVNNTTGMRADANLTFVSGTGGIQFRNGFARINTLQEWRSVQKPWSLASAIGNPSFNAGITNGAATINFTLNAASPASRAAIPLSYITTDLGGNIRSGTPSIGSFDLGLSALTAATDVYTPRITYTPSGNRPAINTTFANVIITDVGVGVPTTGATAPRLWYRNATTASVWGNVSPTSFTGTANNATFQYNFNWTAIGGTPSVGDKIMYYFVAQDGATTPNIWYSQYAASDPVHPNVSTQTVAATSLDSFLVVTPLSTTITIPGTYPSLTGPGGFFEAVNSAALGGNTTVTITADVNETGQNQLNSAGLAGFRLLIQPDASPRTLWGNSTTSLIRLNGVSNVVFDGGPFKNLRIIDSIGSTTSATVGATIEFLGGCSNDTLVNCIIEGNGSSTTRGTVTLGSGTNTNIVIANNEIRAAGNDTLRRPAIAVFSSNVSNSNITVGGVAARPGGNNIYDFTSAGISMPSIGDGIIIGSSSTPTNGNAIYNTSSGAAITGVSIGAGNNHIIANNKMYLAAGAFGLAGGSYTGINVTGGGTSIQILDNSIGGSDAGRSGRAIITSGAFIGINVNVSPTALQSAIRRNLISNMRSTSTGAQNSAILCAGGNIMVGGVNPSDGNIIGTLTDSLSAANSIHGINISGGVVTVQNNTVQGIVYQDTDFERSVGIYVSGASTDTIISNTIRNIRHYSASTSGSLTTTFAPAGIYIAAGSNHLVRNNIISSLGTNSGTASYPIFGIKHATATGSLISGNRISNMTTTGTGTGTNGATIVGIQSESGSATYIHNQIAIGTGAGNDAQVIGILDQSTGTNNFFHNSVFINGAGTGNNHSYGINRTSTSAVNVRNNLFYNKRVTTGTGRGFAVGSTNAVTSNNLNYNTLIVNDTAAIAQLASVTQGWTALGSLFTASYNTNWAERTSVVPAENLFIDTLSGNLGINSANPEAWYVNGKGIRIIGQTGDFNTASGVRSGSIATGAVDIGSVEFVPTSLPPIAFADKAPAALDSTQFFFGSRMIAKATWGASGSVPSNVDVRYYSGVNPSNTLIGSTFMNAYWEISQTGGAGYSYGLTLMQDSAVLGTVVNPNNLGIARYNGTATSWARFNPTVSNNITGFMSANGINAVGIFTGTDVTNNPLPVKLTVFKGVASQGDVALTWTTVSESNNKGFDIERSADGRTFEFAGFVEGAGNSNVATNYAHVDEQAFAKTNSAVLYYRLKQMDVDGTVTYSNTIKVSQESDNVNALSVFPNPFVTNYNVSFDAMQEGTVKIEMVDIQGKVVFTQTSSTTKGLNTITMNTVSDLQAGVYFVKVNVDGEMQTLKLVKN